MFSYPLITHRCTSTIHILFETLNFEIQRFTHNNDYLSDHEFCSLHLWFNVVNADFYNASRERLKNKTLRRGIALIQCQVTLFSTPPLQQLLFSIKLYEADFSYFVALASTIPPFNSNYLYSTHFLYRLALQVSNTITQV